MSNEIYVIAVDFDGTLCENKYPKIGEPKWDVINYLKNRQCDDNVRLILWSCRVDQLLNDAVMWCQDHGLIFNAVNQNLPEIIEYFGGDTRKIYANEYIDDKNILCNDISVSSDKKSGLLTWAEEEIKIACEFERGDEPDSIEYNYARACYESALKAFKSLTEDGHSGYSIGFTKQILNRLIDGKPLTPIEDVDNIWNEVNRNKDGVLKTYQCRRMSSLFKDVYDDGTITYSDVNRFIMVDTVTDTSWSSGLINRILGEMYPVTMPYTPADKPYKAICEEFLTDRKNGDYDTIGIIKAIEPDGKTVEINRYFKDAKNGWDEISLEEFKHRKAKHYERENSERKEKENS